MERKHLLAAETFRYSYAHYAEHLQDGHVRFKKYMPHDIDILERAEREGWDDARLARAIEVPEQNVDHWRKLYRHALDIVDAPTPAEAFRRSVRYSIQTALEKELETEQDIEGLVVQICYAAADLGYLLDMQRERLSDYSGELRKEPGVKYWDDRDG